jgi:hypothetical protein
MNHRAESWCSLPSSLKCCSALPSAHVRVIDQLHLERIQELLQVMLGAGRNQIADRRALQLARDRTDALSSEANRMASESRTRRLDSTTTGGGVSASRRSKNGMPCNSISSSAVPCGSNSCAAWSAKRLYAPWRWLPRMPRIFFSPILADPVFKCAKDASARFRAWCASTHRKIADICVLAN